MSIQSRTYLEGKIETGDKPVQQDFYDWLDSFFHLTEDSITTTWGNISGTLSSQTDLQAELNAKEDSFSKNTAFNLNLGTSAGTVSEGDHSHTSSDVTDFSSSVNSLIAASDIGDLSNVDETGKVVGYTLSWDGANWSPQANSSAVWGSITGTLSNQTDLQSVLDAKSPTSHVHSLQVVTDAGNTTTNDIILDGTTIFSDPISVGGLFGSLVIDGGATGGWEGFSIGGRVVFAHNNGISTGIHDDVNDQWMFFGTLGAETQMRYAGSKKLETSNTGGICTGVFNATTNLQEAGTDISDIYEAVLGNPASDGDILSSTTLGVRSWVPYLPSPITELSADRYGLTADTDEGTLLSINNTGVGIGTRTLVLDISNGTTQAEAALQVNYGSSQTTFLADGLLFINGGTFQTDSVVKMQNLPTSDPSTAWRLWTDEGVVSESGSPTLSTRFASKRLSGSPASNATGGAGDMQYDSTYLYVCYATDSWGRLTLTTGY